MAANQDRRRMGRYPTDNRFRPPNGYVYVRPSSADGGKRRKRGHGSGSGKGGLYKLAKLFRKQRQTPVVVGGRSPGVFMDELAAERRSESPELPAFRGQRSYSAGSRTTFKLIKSSSKERNETFFMWKPCKVCAHKD